MEIVSCTPDDLADAFAEWERRARDGRRVPPRFVEQTPEAYGLACATYFRLLLEAAGRASSDPLRRALALGWTPPPPDTDRFWYSPDHGPVHEDDLAGVLRREGLLS